MLTVHEKPESFCILYFKIKSVYFTHTIKNKLKVILVVVIVV